MKTSITLLSAFVLVFLWNCSQKPETGPGETVIENNSSLPGEKVLIRIQPLIGETQKMQMTMDMSSEGNLQMESVLNADIDLKAVSGNDGVYTFSLEYNSLKFTTDTGGISFSYDSDAESQSGMATMFDSQIKSFIGKPLRMKMDELGRIIEFSLPGQGSTEQFGDMASMAIPLPREAVGAGDSWTAERSVDGVGVLQMDMTLEKVTASDLLIQTRGTISANGRGERGDFSGEYRLDRSTGMTKEGKMDMETTIENQPVRMKLNFKTK